MEILRIKDGLIAEHALVSKPQGDYITVKHWHGTVGEPIAYYDADNGYKRYTQVELITKGIIDCPQGMKLVDGELVEMTQVEKIEAGQETLDSFFKIENSEVVPKTQVELIEEGLAECPTGMKLVDGELVAKTNEERLADGEITQDEYNAILIAEYKAYLAETDYCVIKIAEGVATSEEYSDILAKRQEMRKNINTLEKE